MVWRASRVLVGMHSVTYITNRLSTLHSHRVSAVNQSLCRGGSRPNSALRSGNISVIRILEVTMTFLQIQQLRSFSHELQSVSTQSKRRHQSPSTIHFHDACSHTDTATETKCRALASPSTYDFRKNYHAIPGDVCEGVVPRGRCMIGFDAMVRARGAWKLTTKNYWNWADGGWPKTAKEVQQLPPCIGRPLFPRRGVVVFESRRVSCHGRLSYRTSRNQLFATHPAFQFHVALERARFPRGEANP
jgi:hypothetical protein